MKSDYDKELAQRNHLPTIRQLYEDHALTATCESRGYEMYLYKLLERECEVRSHIKVERLLKITFTFRFIWSASAVQIMEKIAKVKKR